MRPQAFCILKTLSDGSPHWVEAARTLEAAKARIELLADLWPGKYFVLIRKRESRFPLLTRLRRSPAGKEISTLWVNSAAGSSSFNMSGSAGSLSVNLGEDAGGAGLEIEDSEGFSTVLGRRDVVGGTRPKERKPAASVLLLGKDHKVIWSAP